jgi:tetratricopeptide (TPR) repeat protein
MLAARRRGGRAVDRAGLENRWAREGPVGSNPTPSATFRPTEEATMPIVRRRLALVVVFAAGVAAGSFAAKKAVVTPALYSGRAPAEAADQLLGAARTLAENGSYENIAVARMLYLGGHKAEGQALLDRVLAGKTKPGDTIRVARVYREAGEWDKARPLFDQVVQAAPDDEDWLAEIGAWYLLAGDRARAEELFGRSLAQDPNNLSNTLRMAGAFLGLEPRD